MSDTPRTDAVRGTTELREHAEQLERELRSAHSATETNEDRIDAERYRWLRDIYDWRTHQIFTVPPGILRDQAVDEFLKLERRTAAPSWPKYQSFCWQCGAAAREMHSLDRRVHCPRPEGCDDSAQCPSIDACKIGAADSSE